MPIWLIFAVLVTLGVTALLVAVLYRINLPARDPEAVQRQGEGRDPVLAAMLKDGGSEDDGAGE
jgi:hypothetical protein